MRRSSRGAGSSGSNQVHEGVSSSESLEEHNALSSKQGSTDKCFVNSSTFKRTPEIGRIITKIIKGSFDGPYSEFKKVPRAAIDRWFAHFCCKYTFPESEYDAMKGLFEKRVKLWFRMGIYHYRDSMKQPRFIADEDWNKMVEVWNSDAYKAVRERNRRNRVVANAEAVSSQWRGGSVRQVIRENRLASNLGRTPTILEVFTDGYARDGVFQGSRAQGIADEMQAAMTRTLAETGEKMTSEQMTEEFTRVAGGSRGRTFGVTGSVQNRVNFVPTYRPSIRSDASVQEELSRLRSENKSLKKRMTEMDQRMRQMMEDYRNEMDRRMNEVTQQLQLRSSQGEEAVPQNSV